MKKSSDLAKFWPQGSVRAFGHRILKRTVDQSFYRYQGDAMHTRILLEYHLIVVPNQQLLFHVLVEITIFQTSYLLCFRRRLKLSNTNNYAKERKPRWQRTSNVRLKMRCVKAYKVYTSRPYSSKSIHKYTRKYVTWGITKVWDAVKSSLFTYTRCTRVYE